MGLPSVALVVTDQHGVHAGDGKAVVPRPVRYGLAALAKLLPDFIRTLGHPPRLLYAQHNINNVTDEVNNVKPSLG